MKVKRGWIYVWIVCLCGLVALTNLGGIAQNAVHAQADDPGLPPRPTVPTPTPASKSKSVTGAGIELWVTSSTSPLYAVVQWQDGLGEWHDVEGWRGRVEDGHVLWFVSKDHFGQGPFRWLLYQDAAAPAASALATSESFDLPDKPNMVVRVRVTAEP
jgi:hypothetical protein